MWTDLSQQIAEDFEDAGGACLDHEALIVHRDPVLAMAQALALPDTCRRDGCDVPIISRARQARYCSVKCRSAVHAPARRKAWQAWQRLNPRQRCSSMELDGRKCRSYARKGETRCRKHGG